jgi:hypothetical protein
LEEKKNEKDCYGIVDAFSANQLGYVLGQRPILHTYQSF